LKQSEEEGHGKESGPLKALEDDAASDAYSKAVHS
jgi:hypothetical protein